MRNKQIELKYNRLTLVEELEPIRYVKSTQRIFLCDCECGNADMSEANDLTTDSVNGEIQDAGQSASARRCVSG